MSGKVLGSRAVDRPGSFNSCIKCGADCRYGESYCSRHDPKRNMRARGGGTDVARVQNMVGERAGWRCEAVEHGTRCSETRRSELQAHRIGGVAAHNDPDRAVLLCKTHHLVVAAAERKARAARRAA